MSLLTHPRHEVVVVDRVEGVDGDGAVTLVESPPFVVPCNVHPVSTDEAESYGLVLSDSYRLTVPAGQWTAGPHAVIRWEGQEFSQVGRVLRSRMGVRTRHDRVLMTRGQTDG